MPDLAQDILVGLAALAAAALIARQFLSAWRTEGPCQDCALHEEAFDEPAKVKK